MRGWDFLWLLAPTALWGFVLIPRRNKLSRSPHPPAGASLPRTLAPAPFSQSRPRAGEPTAHGALPLSAGELRAMEINREAVERLYGGAA